ncbi:MAG: hypothetical protein ACT6RD_03465 [Brevundimonas sp.]|uniref:hypothetical protein n=1 Tax=Brevundimonas sp. TaxID=1871086 RepID=UPI004034E72B
MAARRKSGADTADERAYVTRAEAEAATAAAEWSPPPGAIRSVCVHLTPFVWGCEDLPSDAHGRWRYLTWRNPRQVMIAVLRRIQRTPTQVALRWSDGLAGVEVHDGAHAPAPGCETLLAIVFDVPPADLAEALDSLRPASNVVHLADRRGVGSGGPDRPTTAAQQEGAA